MKISDLIKRLEDAKQENGDLEVYSWDYELKDLHKYILPHNPAIKYRSIDQVKGTKFYNYRYNDELPNYRDVTTPEEKIFVL